WIRAAMLSKYGRILQGTDISEVKYSDIASAFNLDYMRIERSDDIEEVMNSIFKDERPKLVEVLIQSEEKLLPPVPDWENIREAK
ncbi:thiamine pyrophosphate-binding protein, partial [Sulfolobus sp. F3]